MRVQNFNRYIITGYFLFAVLMANAQISQLEKQFQSPPESARPWVFWYWMHGAVSKPGITADLEAMKQIGIGGAYLMPIKDTSFKIPFSPTVRQLSPEWWQMVKFAMQEAKRLNLKLAMHVSDGFALAGGPWITPELSMQKLVWSKTYIKAGTVEKINLAKPAFNENYYKDVAVFAYPAAMPDFSLPEVTTSNGSSADFLANPKENKSFKSDTACWIQYKYATSFTLRSVTVHIGGLNFQALRLIVQSSDDGINFTNVTRLEPPRHGWQDTDEDYTWSIAPTNAKYFRFVYNKEGTEPGSEDIDAAKWKPSFKLNGIYLGDEPVINQYQAKNGSIWRVASNTSSKQVSDADAIALNTIVDLTGKLDSNGNLNWSPPANKAGNWVIVRMGHTSTGHTNYTGGAGLGLECDKFNPTAIKLQFDNWFAKAFEKTDPSLANQVLKIFHIDSWECGSQNWSPVFLAEFKKRRGYDLKPYLLVMTGIPIENAATSEKILHDVRQTIADLVNDVFYKTLSQLAHNLGAKFVAEAIAPTMVSDGLLHYKTVDIPMGEFWLNSPTHDKPNDMLDAISGAHIYGKNIIQSESFTSVRMNWSEHPGNLKAIGDRNLALGVNRLVFHVFAHNPWMDKKPGMTLDGVGLYFQRDQTWFKQSKAWIDYLMRCQALLQMGKPVVDIAVFTGEELPRRSILPDRFVNDLPGIFGKQRVDAEKLRLENKGQPMRTIPDGVSHSANMADPEDWIDPLNGYAYDSFNPDALMMASVKDGKIVLPGGASYKLLLFPGRHPMQPNNTEISLSTAKKILQLLNAGATIIMHDNYSKGIGFGDNDIEVRKVLKEIFETTHKGKLIRAPYTESSFEQLGISRDVEKLTNPSSLNTIAWTHRKLTDGDLYFISNQTNLEHTEELSFSANSNAQESWDPLTGEIFKPESIKNSSGRTFVKLRLAPAQSVFIVFRKDRNKSILPAPVYTKEVMDLSSDWTLKFDASLNGPADKIKYNQLQSWTQSADSGIRYYSGTVIYENDFTYNAIGNRSWLRLDSVNNIASVKVNGKDCGTIWTAPYTVEITKALKPGNNHITIEVTNTWTNRLMGDNLLPENKRVTFTTAPFRLANKPLLPAGIIGKVGIFTTK